MKQSRQRALRNLTAALSRGDPNTFNQVVVEQTAEMLTAKICSGWLVDQREQKLKLGANFGVISKENIPEYNINWNAENDKEIKGTYTLGSFIFASDPSLASSTRTWLIIFLEGTLGR